jgi:hypothetical protein
MSFFESMESLEKAFWFIALPSSLIFIIQTILTFIGSDASDGTSADFDSDLDGADAPFQLFSLRNLINFLLGFSWTGISFFKIIDNSTVLILISFLVGALFVYLFFLIIQFILKLSEDNSFNIKNTVNKTGTVYLRIPANKTGYGIVQISVKGSVHEINAVTTNEEIQSGTMIRVTEVLDNNLLLVQIL